MEHSIIKRPFKKKIMKKLIIIIAIVLGSAFTYGFYLFHKPHQGIANKEAAYTLQSKQIFDEYDQNETAANKKYLGKVVCVYGKVADKAVDAKGTLSFILEGGDMAGVGCQFDKSVIKEIENIKKGETIRVKGICTGMLMDVVLVDCVPEESN
jgi:hypothetical protein